MHVRAIDRCSCDSRRCFNRDLFTFWPRFRLKIHTSKKQYLILSYVLLQNDLRCCSLTLRSNQDPLHQPLPDQRHLDLRKHPCPPPPAETVVFAVFISRSTPDSTAKLRFCCRGHGRRMWKVAGCSFRALQDRREEIAATFELDSAFPTLGHGAQKPLHKHWP